jgi:pimeloyl-ACP methyl ester carboxylesterase
MHRLRVNDYDMAYVERGAGVPLLLLHGGFVDYRLWQPQMDDFSARYRTIAVSFRRCWPERWNGEGEGYTTQQHVADIAAFIEALCVQPVHLLGPSLGAHVAFRLAQRHPNHIRSLVLVEPAGPFDKSLEPPEPPTAPPLVMAPLITAATEHIRRGEIDQALAPIVDALSADGGWRDLDGEKKQILRDNAGTVLGLVRDQRAPITRENAEAIKAPTLLIAGERSPEVFQRSVTGLLSAIKNARRVTIPGASHVSHWDNPVAFNREVLAFLSVH